MKKLLLAILVVATSIVSCTKNQSKNKSKTSIVNKAADIHDIDYCEASKLIKEYWDNSGTDPQRTRSVWFSYAEIHKLDSILKVEMDSISNANIKNHIDSTMTTDGVRIYFARYTKEYDIDHRNKNTVVIVSTKDTIDPKYPTTHMHLDYYPQCVQHGVPQNNGELCPSHCDGVTLPKP